MSWRVVFMAVGLSVSAFAGGFVQGVGGGMRGILPVMSWLYGGICLVTMLATVFATGRIVGNAPTTSTSLSLRPAISPGRRQPRAICDCCWSAFCRNLAEGVGYGSFAYFCIYVVQQPLSGIGLVVLAEHGGTGAGPATVAEGQPPLVGGDALYAGVMGWCLNVMLWLAMDGRSPLWLIPLGLEAGASAGGFLMVTLALLSNTMAADAAASGRNCEGIYSGVWLAAEKLAFALGALIVGLVIGAFGFVESANGVQVVQTSWAVAGVAVAYCGVNTLIYLSSVLAIRSFGRQGRAPAPRLVATP